MWFSRLGVTPQSKSSPVAFPVQAHAWVMGSVPRWGACAQFGPWSEHTHTRSNPSMSLTSVFLSLRNSEIPLGGSSYYCGRDGISEIFPDGFLVLKNSNPTPFTSLPFHPSLPPHPPSSSIKTEFEAEVCGLRGGQSRLRTNRATAFLNNSF